MDGAEVGEVAPPEAVGTGVPDVSGVGEPGGVGLGFAFGVPFVTGGGSAPPPAGVLVGVTPEEGGIGVGVGPVTGGFVGVFVGTGLGVGVGTVATVAVGFAVGILVGATVGGTTVSVGLTSAGDSVVPTVAVSDAVACVAVCMATIPVTENNTNAQLTARMRKTQYASSVDFLCGFFGFIRPHFMNNSSVCLSVEAKPISRQAKSKNVLGICQLESCFDQFNHYFIGESWCSTGCQWYLLHMEIGNDFFVDIKMNGAGGWIGGIAIQNGCPGGTGVGSV